MEAKELRIGNYVSFAQDGTNFQVEEILETGLSVYNATESTWIELDQFEGIPLTEQRLKKLGFKEQMGRHGVYSKDRLRIVVKEGLGALAYLIDEDNSRGYYIPNECKHVHKLQNLYFALTGEELTLK